MKRHPLLIYGRRFRAWRWPALFIAIGCGVLWWFAPDLFAPDALDLAAWALLVGLAVGLMLFAYTFVAPALAYVECTAKFLIVNTPFYRLAVSYGRIRGVRPVRFAPPGVSGLRRELVQPLLGQTAVVVDLNGYPMSERWLRFWLGWFLFPHDSTGLLFVTPDWMALSRDIDVHRAEVKMRRSQR